MGLFFFFSSPSARAEKTDVVVMSNEDHLTGEVKMMDLGLLTLKTDDMGTLSIQWEKVVGLRALKQYFRLEREDGFLMYGSIDTDTIRQKLLVVLDTVKIPLDFKEIVRITPIKLSFWDRLSGSADLGYSYTKASTVSQLTFSGKGTYRTLRNSVEINWSTVYTTQKDKPMSLRRDLSLLGKHIYRNKWFLQAGSAAQQNSELGLDLRLALNGGGGKNLIQNNRSLLLGGGGLSVNREWTGDYSSSIYNLESVLVSEYSHFIYQHPQINLNSRLQVYPGLSDWGRLRSEFDFRLKWEIIKDLYWSLSFYDSYDNRPPGAETAKNDFGISLSLGYIF